MRSRTDVASMLTFVIERLIFTMRVRCMYVRMQSVLDTFFDTSCLKQTGANIYETKSRDTGSKPG